MTLIEKLKEEEIQVNLYTFKLTTESAERFTKIFDDYAIEFADYINRNSYRSFNGGWYLTHIKKTTEEMLEIFKKEKGL